MKLVFRVLAAGITFLAAAGSSPTRAETAAQFYANRQMTMLVGTTAGDGYDTFGRMLARHMGKYLPGGSAKFIVRNMPGAGGLIATNFLFNVAEPDGATIGVVNREALLVPLLSADASQAKFDPRQFVWLGSPNLEAGMIYVSKASGVRSIRETEQRVTTLGSSSAANSTGAILPKLLNELIGTKFKVIAGYQGSMQAILAMERGEVDGRYSPGWAGPEANRVNDLVASGKARLLAYVSRKGSSTFGSLPNVIDLPMKPENRNILALLLAAQGFGRPFIAPPRIPAERATALRDAFIATMKDPDYLAEAESQKLEITPVAAADLANVANEAYATPAPLLKRAVEMMGEAQK
ncbi:MAG TPA: tripartite tricarboxylate transporter substrate-binding protein [Xanthobacteraceae bacterium]|jgi:tripartite-type tricarboxylate transporter receptor subunit TctC